MRYLHELIGLAAVAAAVSWVQRAPPEPTARARYLCRPVHVAARTVMAVQAMLDDQGRVAPPHSPTGDTVDETCQRMVQVFVDTLHD
jgi:hypothetical protein